MLDAEFFGGVWIHFHERRGTELVAVCNLAGARARVKVFNEAPAVEPEWELVVGLFVIVLEAHGNQIGLAVWSRKFAIAVQPCIAFESGRTLPEWPLNTACGFNLVVGHAADIECTVSTLGQSFHFVK